MFEHSVKCLCLCIALFGVLSFAFDPLSLQDQPEILAKLRARQLDPSIALGPNSVYRKESDAFRGVVFDEKATGNANPEWRRAVNEMFAVYRPKYHPLWLALKELPSEVLTNKWWLGEFYKRYQAAMHVTRVEVFKTPNLCTPDQRKRLLAILNDDDSSTSTSHHQDLENLFRHFGAVITPESWFHDPVAMLPKLDNETQAFFKGVMKLYPASSGAWTLAELLSDEWLSTLADGFSVQFPDVAKQDYFDEIFTGHVEIQHMTEAVALTEEIFKAKPEMLQPTIQHAKEMCILLNGLWDNLYGLVVNPKPWMQPRENEFKQEL